jgi:hypothetical protein
MTQFKGIGEDAPEGWVVEEFEVPLPSNLQDIVEALKVVLKQGKVQSVSLELGKPIRYTRFVKQDEAQGRCRQEQQSGMNLGDVARNVYLEEYSDVGGYTPAEILLRMMLQLEARRLHLTHIGVGPNTRMFDWLGIDKVAYGAIENLGGAELVRDKDIPDERLVFFGSPQHQGRTDQITYGLIHHLFLEKEDTSSQEVEKEDVDG